MFFSKSFGYALRGILYVALKEQQHTAPLDEIAEALGVPRHFMGKIMKRLVQGNILSSLKGPAGGFFLKETTLIQPLIEIYRITDSPEQLEHCVLNRGLCNEEHPCRLHDKIFPLKSQLNSFLFNTTVGELLGSDKDELLRSLTATNP